MPANKLSIAATIADKSLKLPLPATILSAEINFDCRYSKYPFSPYRSVTLINLAFNSCNDIEPLPSIPANSLLIMDETLLLNAPEDKSFWISPDVRVMPSLFKKLLDEPDAEDLLPPDELSRR